MPAGAICPVRTALVVRTVWAWNFERPGAVVPVDAVQPNELLR